MVSLDPVGGVVDDAGFGKADANDIGLVEFPCRDAKGFDPFCSASDDVEGGGKSDVWLLSKPLWKGEF